MGLLPTLPNTHQSPAISAWGLLSTPFSCQTLVLSLALLSLYARAAPVHAIRSFDSIYAFGDSLTDTGNSLRYQLSINVDPPEGHLPYGETFFHYPTGRISDGRVVIDFLAKRVKAPHFLVPYLGLNDTQINGKWPSLVNFAVGGVTALNVEYLKVTYNISVFIPYSLDKQLQWFSMLPISKNKEALSKALIYFGEIGVNDYNRAFEHGFSIEFVIIEFVPNVLKAIRNALEFLIESGARYLVVEGGYPIGCTPEYTRHLFPNATIDENGCVEELHRLREIHDKLLKELILNLTAEYNEDVHITFFDQVKAFTNILKHPSHYGFTNTTDPCFDSLHSTNLTNVSACPNPSTYVNWDGIHFTEAANNVLLNLFYTKGFVASYPNILT